jgi:pectate lyase
VHSPLDLPFPDAAAPDRARPASRRPWRRAAFAALAMATLLLPGPFLGPDAVAGGEVAGSANVGYGRLTVGGRGGSIVRVRNRNDSGPGSLRAALERSGRRIVRFDVGGVFALRSEIKIKDPFVTIAGETAPRPVVIKNEALLVRTHDVIIRHMRLRPGDRTSTPSDTDALTLNGNDDPVYNVVVNHVSMVWGPDIGGLAILGEVRRVTIQNSIMGEGLYLSRHPEGTRGHGGHSHAANITQLDRSSSPPARITFWRNLFTTSDTRVPRFQGAFCVDVVNNLIYNWGHHSASGNPRSLNLVANWYRRGPRMQSTDVYSTQTSSVAPSLFSDAVYAAANRADGFTGRRGGPSHVYASSVRCGGLSVTRGTPHSARDAVLASAGATLPWRDEKDRRIIKNVVQRQGKYFNGVDFKAPNPYY